ncbi:MAG: hypothetical protein KKA73_28260 [Chloroflexi bacterium]|nr:hypothetical protein [Chloroflexota bacterium]MBU1751588.1 hypothetical protein [Chloroflexota bacterium]
MSQRIDLKEIEKRAFRSTFQDGLWDIFLGLLLLNMGLGTFIGGILGEGDDMSFPQLALIMMGLTAFVALVLLGFFVGKKFITTPRIGRVKFGPARKTRRKAVILVLSLSVLVGVILLGLGLMFSIAPPEWVALGWLIPAGAFGVNAVVVLSLIAYYMDYTRAYVYGWFYALSFPVTILLAEYLDITFPIAYVVFAGIMVLIGTLLFIRFLRQYPMPAEEESHDRS